ncbi:hypothetical protein DY000_02013639 [Brassica cretica]|uniref:Uncharacterized protein n=1 Tax=Brassica cretica TaxID=69181 RepID=A0ABQ7CNK0_BRACR|nr:hypothetical protein DY000_02013639 [Brassica cretica]
MPSTKKRNRPSSSTRLQCGDSCDSSSDLKRVINGCMINRFVAYHESSHRYEIRKVSLYQASTPTMANFDDCDFFMWVEELRLLLHQWFERLDFVTLIQDLRLHPSMNLGVNKRLLVAIAKNTILKIGIVKVAEAQ